MIEQIGVPIQKQTVLIRRELAAFFFIPLVLPLSVITVLIIGAQKMFGDYVLQEGLIPIYGIITLLVFAVIYISYFAATCSVFKHTVLNQNGHVPN